MSFGEKMKSNLFIAFLGVLITLFITACNKERQLQKDLAGNWEISQLKLIDKEGFDSYFKAAGSLVIEEFSDNKSRFTINCTYTDDNGLDKNENFSGTIYSAENTNELVTDFEINNQIETGLSVVFYHGINDIKIELRSSSKRLEVIGNNEKK